MIVPPGVTDPDAATDEEIIAAAMAAGDSREDAEALLAALRGSFGLELD